MPPSIKRAALAAMLTLAPQSAEGGSVVDAFEKEIRSLGFEPIGLPVSADQFPVGAWLMEKNDTHIAGEICTDCCNASKVQVRPGTATDITQTREIDKEYILKLKANLPAPGAPGVEGELGLTKVTSTTLALEDVQPMLAEVNQMVPFLQDRLCMRNIPGDDELWVVTQVLIAKPTFTLKDVNGQKVKIAPEGVPYVNTAFEVNLQQTTTGTLESVEPLVVGFRKEKLAKVGMSQVAQLGATSDWKERHEDCEEEYDKYCEDLEDVQAASKECENHISNPHAGSLTVTWTKETAVWSPSKEMACESHRFMALADEAYDGQKCETFSADGKQCANEEKFVVVPERGMRLKDLGDKKLEDFLKFTPEGSANWYTRGPSMNQNAAKITVVAHGPEMVVELCLPQEELKGTKENGTTPYEFTWGKETKVWVPHASDNVEVSARYTSLGRSVEPPNLNPELAEGLTRDTDSLEFKRETNEADGRRYFWYEPKVNCVITKHEDLPPPPAECGNCGTFSCKGH